MFSILLSLHGRLLLIPTTVATKALVPETVHLLAAAAILQQLRLPNWPYLKPRIKSIPPKTLFLPLMLSFLLPTSQNFLLRPGLWLGWCRPAVRLLTILKPVFKKIIFPCFI